MSSFGFKLQMEDASMIHFMQLQEDMSGGMSCTKKLGSHIPCLNLVPVVSFRTHTYLSALLL